MSQKIKRESVDPNERVSKKRLTSVMDECYDRLIAVHSNPEATTLYYSILKRVCGVVEELVKQLPDDVPKD